MNYTDNNYNNMDCSLDFTNIYFECINYYLNVLFYGVIFGVISFTFIYVIIPICGAFMVILIGGIIYDMLNLFKNIKNFIKYLFVYSSQNYKITFNMIVFIFTINIIFQIIYQFFIEENTLLLKGQSLKSCYNI